MSESDPNFHTEESNSSLGVLLRELELEASEIWGDDPEIRFFLILERK